MTEPVCLCHLSAIRERRRLTQAELTRRANLSRQTVDMIERERFVPSVMTALMLGDALECKVGDLFHKPRWVAIPAAASSEAAGFGKADGELVFRSGNSGM